MDNSPFFHDDFDTADLIWQEYKSNAARPIMLVSPFWEETKSNSVVDSGGGDAHFRTAISEAWQENDFGTYCSCIDGLFRRPLRQTDVDIMWIKNVLRDLPIILAYGYSDGESIRPKIATWNVIPHSRANQISTFNGKMLTTNGCSRSEVSQTIGLAMIGAASTLMGITEDGKDLYRELQSNTATLQKSKLVDVTSENVKQPRTRLSYSARRN